VPEAATIPGSVGPVHEALVDSPEVGCEQEKGQTQADPNDIRQEEIDERPALEATQGRYVVSLRPCSEIGGGLVRRHRISNRDTTAARIAVQQTLRSFPKPLPNRGSWRWRVEIPNPNAKSYAKMCGCWIEEHPYHSEIRQHFATFSFRPSRYEYHAPG
jgi:hypothetical protein